jgi:hypothetical protein
MATQDQNPLAVPTISSGAITVDLMLQQPTRINNYLSSLPLMNLFATDIFSGGEQLSGGAIVFDRITLNDLRLDTGRSIQNVEPGGEFPIVTASSGAPSVALPEKFGGKFWITDEARDRNDEALFQRKSRKLINEIVIGLNARSIVALEAAITEFTATQTVTGVNWGTATTTAAGSKTAAGDPAFDFAKVQLAADVAELGVNIDTLIVHPNQASVLRTVYGAGNVGSVLADNGIDNLIVSARVTAGTAYALEAGQVGEIRFEKGISTETWRTPENQKNWVQSDVRVAMAVTQPYSLFKLTGLAG